MSKAKKKSIFKRIFSSNQDCCSVDIEEVEEDKNTEAKKADMKKDNS